MWEGVGSQKQVSSGVSKFPTAPFQSKINQCSEGPCLQRPNKNRNLLNLNACSIFGQSPPSVVSRVSQVRSTLGSSLGGRGQESASTLPPADCHLGPSHQCASQEQLRGLWGSSDRSTCQGQWPAVLEDTRVALPTHPTPAWPLELHSHQAQECQC